MNHGFFTIISREEFVGLLRQFSPLAPEIKSLTRSAGRVLANDIVAQHDWPLQDRSCMDGFAVNARDIFGATESNPGYLECVASLSIETMPDIELNPGECARIATGGVLPRGANAVVMVEHTQAMEADTTMGTIEIRKSVAPGENVMQRGEDARKDAVALAAGTTVRPQEIGLAAALGFEEISLRRRPRVGILSTGDELIEINETPNPGQVRDVNSLTIAALVKQANGKPTRYGIIKDDLESLSRALKKALEDNDMVLLSGGSSIGVRDLTVQAIESMKDAEILAHGVALSPGKPTILGRVADKPILGLPGQVTSALVVMHVLVLPLVRHLQGDDSGFTTLNRARRKAVLARNVASKPGREDYIRIRLEERDGQPPLAHPVLGKSGLLRTIVQAQGLAAIPADSEGLYNGELIDVWII
ncbi:molybdopterin molybdenumtransferase MoeA [Pseudodesulfovibrio sp. JC047]|uniref:molybdopterin molybdotransferase MoeA n=1 Tax=Pseudodesulfovibrio sp. JC047 TaxID=2683199 RepID=UPI0013D6837F|nr:gephyrin-like molybdotransferase Glp [Pseudodesulfovibrio sp. JC047]NDV20204.1 molybdopterin molybdenumtransferase MoeA [Pseudodesulfovibrio sp. JC047]